VTVETAYLFLADEAVLVEHEAPVVGALLHNAEEV